MDDVRGMFAFALWDTQRRTLLLARDRLGNKPLYYARRRPAVRVRFGAQVPPARPAVPREVDPRSIADFLTFQYVPSPQRIFQGVRKLPPGHRLVCDANGPRVERYWSLPVEPDRLDPPPTRRSRELRELLAEAVRIRLMSDVPLGAFLSRRHRLQRRRAR